MHRVPPAVDRGRCNDCGRCVPVCPAGVMRMTPEGLRTVSAGCLACGHCVAACPREALSIGGLEFARRFETVETDLRWVPHGRSDGGSLLSLMASRRSCRNFLDRPVPEAMIRDLVQAATLAPSGTNSQGWTFTVLPDRAAVLALGQRCLKFFDRLVRLSEIPWLRAGLRLLGRPELAAFHQDYAPAVREGIDLFRRRGVDRLFWGAPAVILIGSLPGSTTPREDALLAAQNLLLAAHAMGLGTCLVGFAVEALQRDPSLLRSLGCRPGERIHAVVALGWPGPAERYRRFPGRFRPPVRFRKARDFVTG